MAVIPCAEMRLEQRHRQKKKKKKPQREVDIVEGYVDEYTS
jgi:hypothetical protein